MPVDDENTLSVTWAFTRVPREREPYVQGRIPAWHGPVKDADGRWISSHVMNQDFVAWIGQGTIADRTQEHLGTGDRGVILLRQRFLEDLAAIRRGEDPEGDHSRSGSKRLRAFAGGRAQVSYGERRP